MDLQWIRNELTSCAAVSGLAICASARRGYQDSMSDIDLWVFLEPDSVLSRDMVLDDLLPNTLRAAVLDEGRDDSWADYVVLNLLYGGEILNLKVLRMELLSDFCSQTPSWDLDYMENLENYWAMEVLYDRSDLLDKHKTWLENYAIRKVGDTLAPELLRRYAIHYWRSVYQGVLRNEELGWTNQIFYLAELLVSLAYLCEDRLPPDKKWILSTKVLDELGVVGVEIRAALTAARQVSLADKSSVLDVYVHLSAVEELLVDLSLCGWEQPWWRRVFDERMRTHGVSASLVSMIQAKLGRYLTVGDHGAGVPDLAGTP
jgi:predicted nucleotidyltransferase